ncbi:MAG: hypothetical protein KAX38_08230, partial [Candidatus Krumholzibacteria bacterium]|nr:hypothetical protein [Candidatus Krumholzibacteria bacterium]
MYDLFSVRGGWDAGIPTFGCGFGVGFLLFDYAYRSTELGSNHLFSLTYRFGASKSERLAARRRRKEKEIRTEIEAQIRRFEDNFIKTSLEKGEESLKGGDYEAALDHFHRVLLWSPENEQAEQGVLIANASLSVLEGDTLMRKAKFAEALFSYRRAYESMQTPDIESRISRCEKEIEESVDRKEMVEKIVARAFELYTEREWGEAARGFEKVLDLVPGHGLAAEYLQRTRDRMKESYKKIVKRVERFVAEKHFGAALELLRKGIEQYPGDEKLERKLAEVAELRKEAVTIQREARSRRGELVRISQDEIEVLRPAYEKGVEYFKRGNFAKAISEWEHVWNKYPQFEKVEEYLIKAYQYSGMEFYAQHRYKESLEVWGKMLDVDPDNEKAIRYISRTREELARLEGLTR